MRHRSVVGALLAVLALVTGACGGGGKKATANGSEQMVGLFKLAPGTCSTAGVTAGSSFRMINPGGKAGEGPYISNGDSPCSDKTFSPMFPGSDGGLLSGPNLLLAVALLAGAIVLVRRSARHRRGR